MPQIISLEIIITTLPTLTILHYSLTRRFFFCFAFYSLLLSCRRARSCRISYTSSKLIFSAASYFPHLHSTTTWQIYAWTSIIKHSKWTNIIIKIHLVLETIMTDLMLKQTSLITPYLTKTVGGAKFKIRIKILTYVIPGFLRISSAQFWLKDPIIPPRFLPFGSLGTRCNNSYQVNPPKLRINHKEVSCLRKYFSEIIISTEV